MRPWRRAARPLPTEHAGPTRATSARIYSDWLVIAESHQAWDEVAFVIRAIECALDDLKAVVAEHLDEVPS